jgi:hypothetical protein
MQRKRMTIISSRKLSRLSEYLTEYELVEYDSVKYRKNPTEVDWEGKVLVGLPLNTLALVAAKGTDAKGDFIKLSMAMPLKEPLTQAA